MRTRAMLTALAAAAIGATALPSQAAGTGSATLYFANEGSSTASGCKAVYVLDKAATGSPCASIQAGFGGNGLLAKNSFASVPKAVGFKLSPGKHVTGVVYFASYPLISDSAVPLNTLPGPMAANVTISINGVTVGTVAGSGQALTPNSDLAVPIDLALPGGLGKQVVRSVQVDIAYKTALGVMGADYSASHSSKLVFATTK